MNEPRDPRTIIYEKNIHTILEKECFASNNIPLRTSDKLVLARIIRELIPLYEIGRNRDHISGRVKERDIALGAFQEYLALMYDEPDALFRVVECGGKQKGFYTFKLSQEVRRKVVDNENMFE